MAAAEEEDGIVTATAGRLQQLLQLHSRTNLIQVNGWDGAIEAANQGTAERLHITGVSNGSMRREFVEVFRLNTTVKSLKISGGLESTECCMISVVLKFNQTLESLDLEGNPVGDSGAAYLAQALMLPETRLKSLGLNSCGIGDDGARALIEAMATNRFLCALTISDNSRLSAEMFVALQRAVFERKIQSSFLNPEETCFKAACKENIRVNWIRANLVVLGANQAERSALVNALVESAKDENNGEETNLKLHVESWQEMNTEEFNEEMVSFIYKSAAKKFARFESGVEEKEEIPLIYDSLSPKLDMVPDAFSSDYPINELINAPQFVFDSDRFQVALKEMKREKMRNDAWEATPVGFFLNSVNAEPMIQRIFFTDFAVYMLCFDLQDVVDCIKVGKPSKEATRKMERAIATLRFTLHSIASTVKDVKEKVLLVGMNAGKVEKDIAGDGESVEAVYHEIGKLLKKKLKPYQGTWVNNLARKLSFFPVDSTSGAGLESVQAFGESTAKRAGYSHQAIPMNWIRCFKAIKEEAERTAYLNIERVVEIGERYKIIRNELDYMLHYFHQVGALSHYRLTDSTRGIVSLHSDWIADAVATILGKQKSKFLPKELEKDHEEFVTRGLLSKRLYLFRMGIFELELPFLQDLLLRQGLMTSWHFFKGGMYLVSDLLPDSLEHFGVNEDAFNVDVISISFKEYDLEFGHFYFVVYKIAKENGNKAPPPLAAKGKVQITLVDTPLLITKPPDVSRQVVIKADASNKLPRFHKHRDHIKTALYKLKIFAKVELLKHS